MSHRPYNIGLAGNQSQIQPNLRNNINHFSRQASMLDNPLMMAMKQKEIANKIVQGNRDQLNQVSQLVRQQSIKMDYIMNTLNREEQTKSQIEPEKHSTVADCTIYSLEQIKHK